MSWLLVILLCSQLSFVSPVHVPWANSPFITPQLENSLRKYGAANIFITLKAETSNVLEFIANTKFPSRGEKLNALHFTLVQHAAETQQPVINFLSKTCQLSDIKSFWITNQIYVKNASSSLVHSLLATFSAQVLSIDEEFFAHLIQPVAAETNISRTQQSIEWGIEKIQAPEAWKHIGANTKLGNVVVATIDTGVRGTHEALRNNFVGAYGWYDPTSRTGSPSDFHGHGTHTTGTIVGGLGIGVAPNVKWASCRGCTGPFCPQSSLLACGEFIVCPTLANGSNPDCSRAPHVVSNSWGGGRGNTWYNGVIEAWHAAGIIPVFSIGNSGPLCVTADSPGDQNVIGVGSTMNTDAISTFSSVGPSLDGKLKPEITAPGSNIISAYHTDDNAYASLSGTSMAAPHVSGTIALLLSMNSGLSYEHIRELLFTNSDQDLYFSRRLCGGIRDTEFPNFSFGHGRINALKSVKGLRFSL